MKLRESCFRFVKVQAGRAKVQCVIIKKGRQQQENAKLEGTRRPSVAGQANARRERASRPFVTSGASGGLKQVKVNRN